VVASRAEQAPAVGHAQDAPAPEEVQDAPGSAHGTADASYQQPRAFDVSCAQVTTCPPASQKEEVAALHPEGAHWHAAAAPFAEQTWLAGQSTATGPVEQTPEVAVQVTS
jgi:hypothetical protein